MVVVWGMGGDGRGSDADGLVLSVRPHQCAIAHAFGTGCGYLVGDCLLMLSRT